MPIKKFLIISLLLFSKNLQADDSEFDKVFFSTKPLNYILINTYYERAKKNKVIYSQKERFLKFQMTMTSPNKEQTHYPISMRLDGLGPEHFGNEPSEIMYNTYKIKVENNNIQNMTRFRILDAVSVDLSAPFIFNSLLDYYNIFARKYIFVSNNTHEKYRLSVLEEAIDKNFLERNILREGALFKFDAFTKPRDLKVISEQRLGLIDKKDYQKEITEIFSRNSFKHINNKGNKNEFEYAISLMKDYLEGKKKTLEVFDEHNLITTLLVSTLWYQHHHLEKHNIKFYFNPLNKKIYLIPTDQLQPKRYDKESEINDIPFYWTKIVNDNEQYDFSRSWLKNLIEDEEIRLKLHEGFFNMLNNDELLKYIITMNNPLKLFNGFTPKQVLIDNLLMMRGYKDFFHHIRPENISYLDYDHNLIVKNTSLPNKIFNIDHEKKEIFFKKNNNIIKDPIIIPYILKDYVLKIFENQNFIFTKNGSLQVNCNVDIKGKTNKKINFISKSDKSFILFAGNFTNIDNAEFIDFNITNLSKKEFFYTSPITVINSDVIISNSIFHNTLGEDQLNIVNSKLLLINNHFNISLSDSLDIDRGNGSIINNTFKDCGNDCLDISGSDIKIENIKTDKSHDKAISIGENSIVSLNNINLMNCKKVCLAIKDQSIVNVKNLKVTNAKVAIALYKKKQIFDDPIAKFESIEFKNTEIPIISEKINQVTLLNSSYNVIVKSHILKLLNHL